MPLSIPSALMSSSTSGQCTPWPSPMSSQLARCAGVASDSRHDHANGTLMTRPSTKCAVIVSSLTSMRAIRDSTLTAVLMPCLDDRRFVLNDEPTDVIQLAWAKPMVPRQCHGRQPEFGVLSVPTHVDVHGLVAIETVEEKPIRTRNSGNPRHVESRSDRMISRSRRFRQVRLTSTTEPRRLACRRAVGSSGCYAVRLRSPKYVSAIPWPVRTPTPLPVPSRPRTGDRQSAVRLAVPNQ